MTGNLMSDFLKKDGYLRKKVIYFYKRCILGTVLACALLNPNKIWRGGGYFFKGPKLINQNPNVMEIFYSSGICITKC